MPVRSLTQQDNLSAGMPGRGRVVVYIVADHVVTGVYITCVFKYCTCTSMDFVTQLRTEYDQNHNCGLNVNLYI